MRKKEVAPDRHAESAGLYVALNILSLRAKSTKPKAHCVTCCITSRVGVAKIQDIVVSERSRCS